MLHFEFLLHNLGEKILSLLYFTIELRRSSPMEIHFGVIVRQPLMQCKQFSQA